MSRARRRQLGVLSILIAALLASTAQAWSYTYSDNFSADKAETDSHAHSTFWPSGVSPPLEPYLYYTEAGGSQGLAFCDYKDLPAELSYCFPLGSAQSQRTVKGTLQVDVSFPSTDTISQYVPGHLAYRTSSDGATWSEFTSLSAGRKTISISSAGGTCYVTFSGTRAFIDNLSVSLSSPTTTIQVPGDFPTIQAAIDAAGNRDVIEVASGTYSGTGNWDLDLQGKAITLRSANGPESTIIDCSAPTSPTGHRGFYFRGGEGTDTVVSGFTIEGGRVFGSDIPSKWSAGTNNPIGGGIYCEFSSPTIVDCIITDCGAEIGGGIGIVGASPIIADCVITECTAGGLGTATTGGRGGGIGLVEQSDAMISNCDIEDNTGYDNSYGGGIYCWESAAVISGCRIIGNDASGDLDGGGAYCAGALADVLFQNCVIAGNTADAGAGLFAEWKSSYGSSAQRTSVTVANCTIARNDLLGAASAGGGIKSSGVNILVSNSIVWHNDGRALAISTAVASYPVTYSNIEGDYLGEGNIDQDPLFASLGSDDYHLKSMDGRYKATTGTWTTDSQSSPCIDAGDPSTSATEEPSPNGARVNMGAHGGTRQASLSPEFYTFHVDGSSGRDSNNGRSHDRAFKTIQNAINEAVSGDTILVWPGTYKEDLYFSGKAITLQSAADAAVLMAAEAYALSFYYAESSSSVVTNFVIQGCDEGAIYCDEGASPTLKNLTIVNNAFGVIIGLGGGDPYIVNCIFQGNTDGDLFGCRAFYSCIEHDQADSSAHNIKEDPGFADPDNGDFHLKSRYGRYVSRSGTWTTDSVDSPCIDKGDPDEYPRGELTPNGNRINMGAYGNTPYASLSSGSSSN